jgi:hypothetical protein
MSPWSFVKNFTSSAWVVTEIFRFFGTKIISLCPRSCRENRGFETRVYRIIFKGNLAEPSTWLDRAQLYVHLLVSGPTHMCFHTFTLYGDGSLTCTGIASVFGKDSYGIFSQRLRRGPAVQGRRLYLSVLHQQSCPLHCDAVEFDASRCTTVFSEMQKSWWSVPSVICYNSGENSVIYTEEFYRSVVIYCCWSVLIAVHVMVTIFFVPL